MALQPEHPAPEDLVRYRNGNLDESTRQSVAAHLAGCARCSREAETLAAQADLTPGVPEFLAQLGQVRRRLEQQGASGETLKRRVQSELIPYLGPAAADRILEPVAPGGENLLSTIEPILRLFLGRAASSRLVSRIVDRAIMRI